MNKETFDSEISEVTTAFLTAFDNLDWAQFNDFIADEATVFMPWPTFPNQLNGKSEIQNAFRSLFEEIPKTQEERPYLNLRPLDLTIQQIGSAGLVTFHLSEPDHFGRRTLIFEKRNDSWKLVHLHASNFYEQHKRKI
ncbi:MAG: nuclear transport factor 2 family protein [Chloroflexota bacterium]